MSALFLYGTLRDPKSYEIVAGERLVANPAKLTGYRVHYAGDQSYPRIAEADGTTPGILVEPGPAKARIDWYEGGYGYTLRAVTVETADGRREALVYWPPDDAPPAGEPWQLEAWQETWGPMARIAASEAMEYYGQITPKELAWRMNAIRARAHSTIIARSLEPVPPLGPLPTRLPNILDTRRPYTNFFSVLEADLRQPKFDGGLSAVVTRSAFVSADAVVVLPYDPKRDRVQLIEQFRLAPYFRGDPQCFLIEAPAGRIDAGETPEEAARREAREEVGLDLQDLHLVSRSYPSPGGYTEFLHIYVAIADLPETAAGMGGLESEEEDIRSTILDYAEFEAKLDSNELSVGPLVIAGLWLSRHRDGLRAQT